VSLPPSHVIFVEGIERAFPDRQVGGTRLVLTQSTYIVQKWLDAIGEHGHFVATADRERLQRTAPEVFKRRGPWAEFEVRESGSNDAGAPGRTARPPAAPSAVVTLLVRAFNCASADERVQLCRDAALSAPYSPVAALALSSACREVQDLTGARAALDEALRLAPEWEAVHYEDGKFWLGYDDVARARDAFRTACDLMPTFSAAFSNLGAALGELDDPTGALAAFAQALAHDPHGFTVLNNIGVVHRELGRLDASEAAFRRVTAIAPEFVFGHYNLGHTLFLGGRYDEAVAEYEEGQRRDPEKNRRQGCRLAIARYAAGDRAGAERDLWRFANAAPPDEREDLLLEAFEIVSALMTTHPDLDPGGTLLAEIGRQIA